MDRFDLNHEREKLHGHLGYSFDLKSDEARAITKGSRGNHASAFLGTAIRCLLVGLDVPATDLLRKAKAWAEAAVYEREVPKAFGDALPKVVDRCLSQYYCTQALVNWLMEDRHDAMSYAGFVRHKDAFLAASGMRSNRAEVSLSLVAYVDAQTYQRALELWNAGRWKAPRTPAAARSEPAIANVFCRHKLGEAFSEAEVEGAAARFLDTRIAQWLGEGDYHRAGQWAKVIYWRTGQHSLPAKAALLKCHDHLPNAS